MSERIMRLGTRRVHVQIVPCGGTSTGLRSLEVRFGRVVVSITLDLYACVMPAGERPSSMADILSEVSEKSAIDE